MRNVVGEAYFWVLAWALVVSAPSIAAAASHESKQRCVDAASRGQSLRIAGKLLAARDVFVQCAKDECPKVVASRCTTWHEEVVAAIPTIVVKARDGAGSDIVDVSVSIDGHAVATSLDGMPIALDPGPHTLSFARASSHQTEESHVLLNTGEKNRQVTITFSGASSTAPAPATATSDASPPSDASASPGPPTAAWIFAGVAVAALGTGAYFGATGSSDLHSLRDSCAGHCAQSDVDAAWTKLVVSDVAFAAAAVSAGLATWLFLAPRGERPAATSVGVAPTAGGGAFVQWQGRF